MSEDCTKRQSFDFSVLRDLRKRADLTINDVSQRSGVSPAVISKLERNQTSAELETVYRLARTFDLSAQDLIGMAETRLAQRIEAETYESNGFSFESVTYGNFKCLLGKAKQGAKTSKPEIHKNDYEICWVLKGTLELIINDERQELSAGEAVQFDAILEHTYAALTDVELVISHLQKNQRF